MTRKVSAVHVINLPVWMLAGSAHRDRGCVRSENKDGCERATDALGGATRINTAKKLDSRAL
jgi:hypothetical protein